jgi:hypothetical protein
MQYYLGRMTTQGFSLNATFGKPLLGMITANAECRRATCIKNLLPKTPHHSHICSKLKTSHEEKVAHSV